MVCTNQTIPEPTKEFYQEQAQDLILNENVLLQTLGFDVAVDHPHTHVVRTCQLVKGKFPFQLSLECASLTLCPIFLIIVLL